MNILVTGAKGQLGNELKLLGKKYPGYALNPASAFPAACRGVSEQKNKNSAWIGESSRFNARFFNFTDIEELDITDPVAISEFFHAHHPEVVINCAAYTAVDKAEQEPDLAMKINALAVAHLSDACSKNNSLLLHISSDYVFNGKNFRPYIETDQPDPVSSYAKSKLAGEEEMIRHCKNGIIIRTSWLYSSFGNNFVKTILRLSKEKKILNVVFDQIGCPTYARDLAGTILKIIPELRDHKGVEIFHYANEGVTSWYDFAKRITEFAGYDIKINPIETKDYPLPASRPFYSVLNKSKIKSRFTIEIPYWKDSLEVCLKKLL